VHPAPEAVKLAFGRLMALNLQKIWHSQENRE
jgi:hypothetical protein